MLTKQARQFEQWADDKERLMAIKAKKALEQQIKTKKNGAMFLAIMGTILVMIACYGFVFTNNANYSIVLIFGFLVFIFGYLGLKE